MMSSCFLHLHDEVRLDELGEILRRNTRNNSRIRRGEDDLLRCGELSPRSINIKLQLFRFKTRLFFQQANPL